jgi:crossover junction endodeoxyribonuclease RuvC
MRVVALDLSLTCTGWAVADDGPDQPWKVDGHACGTITLPKLRGMERLAAIRDRIASPLRGCLTDAATVVVIEGYSFGSRNSQAHALGELGGVIRLALHEQGRPFVDLPPTVVKKLATGKGNAGKEEVLAAAIRRLDYSGHDNNEADALWLLTAAMIHYGMPGAPDLPAANLSALEKVTWPVLS